MRYLPKYLSVTNLAVLLLFAFSSLTFAQSKAEKDEDKPNFQDPRLLIVKIYSNGTLAINYLKQNGILCLSGKLLEVFSLRLDGGVFSDKMMDRDDIPDAERVERTVWILAQSGTKPEDIAYVVKFVKLTGASPVKMLTDASYQKLFSNPHTSGRS